MQGGLLGLAESGTCVCVRACVRLLFIVSGDRSITQRDRMLRVPPADDPAISVPQQRSSGVQLRIFPSRAAQGHYFGFLLLKIGLSFTFMSANPTVFKAVMMG